MTERPAVRVVATLEAAYVDDTWPLAVRLDREGDRFLNAHDSAMGSLLPQGVRQVGELSAGRARDPSALARAVADLLPGAASDPSLRVALHVDPRVPFETVDALEQAARAQGYVALDVVFRAPDGPRVLVAACLRTEPQLFGPCGQILPTSTSPAGLELELWLRYEGITVAGVGGRVAPGCATTTSTEEPTVGRRGSGYDLDALRACLRRIKNEPQFAEEHSLRFFADRRVPWGQVATVVIAAQRDGVGPLFSDALFCTSQ